ncbi:MAG: DUF4382 domain-containing protein [Gammaproteobacteria bacterium]
MKTLQSLSRLLFIACFGLILAACGGGGGGGGGAAPGVQTGSVGLVLTDNPTDYYDEILVTISCVRLLGDDGQVTIFQGEETFDLLKLREVTELFAVNDRVPAGTYSKIRLCVEDVELIEIDDQGNKTSSQVRKLLGNGKLDLNPRGSFEVRPGETLLIQADWDAEKSIKFNGQPPNNVSLRPVVFVDIVGVDIPDLDKLLRLHGVIKEINRDLELFLLCGTHFGDDDEVSIDFGDRGGCVNVSVRDGTSIFSEAGQPVTLDDVEVGDQATVFGRVLRPELFDSGFVSPAGDLFGTDEIEADYQPRITVAAVLVELGPKGTFARLKGTAKGGLDSADQFPFELDPGQGFADMTSLPVQYFGGDLPPGTRLVDAEGNRASTDDIVDGVRALVRGVISLDPNLISASLIMLESAVSGEEKLAGLILAVETDGSGLRLLPDDASAERCVRASFETESFLISKDEDGNLSTERVPLTPALENLMADIFGTEAVDGCFDAATIIAFDEPLPEF